MNLEIVTPVGAVCDTEVDSVVVPAEDGELGILKGHAPLLASLGEGEIKLKLNNQALKGYRVQGGFLQVQDDKVQVLAEKAEEI